jgi:hypothetical protein
MGKKVTIKLPPRTVVLTNIDKPEDVHEGADKITLTFTVKGRDYYLQTFFNDWQDYGLIGEVISSLGKNLLIEQEAMGNVPKTAFYDNANFESEGNL